MHKDRIALAAGLLLAGLLAAAPGTRAAVPVANALRQQRALTTAAAPGAHRKVLAHYHWFTRSIDNMPHADYYDCWQTPQCEGGAHAASGGYLRDRPVYRAPLAGSDWQTRDKAWEVATAAANGIDGFLFNLVSVDPSDA